MLALVPAIYAGINWADFPAQVPIHWNIAGQADNFADKSTGILLFVLLPWVVYGVMLLAPRLDPKRNFDLFRTTYHRLLLVLVGFMVAVGMLAMYDTLHPEHAGSTTRWIFVLLSLLFAFLGNYLSTVRPNYFVGFRFPWTLENEDNWVKTHRFGGKLWFWGGILLAARYMLLPVAQAPWLFIVAIVFLSLAPAVYSYRLYRRG